MQHRCDNAKDVCLPNNVHNTTIGKQLKNQCEQKNMDEILGCLVKLWLLRGSDAFK